MDQALKNCDLFAHMTADEAKKYGLIDKIIVTDDK